MFKQLNEKAWLVGGAIRDLYFGYPPVDKDWTIEATVDEFNSVFPDAVSVSTSFPVYIIDGCDVALTRTEKSTGNGYGDFEVSCVGVPIIDDLKRRDFTINSIAQNFYGDILDPYGGLADIENLTLRTVFDEAFEEDPVRILRGARFVMRYGLSIDHRTFHLMMKSAHKLQYVAKERIVVEMEKMWAECNKFDVSPSVFFETLAELDALRWFIKPLDDCRFVTAGPVQWHNGNTTFEHLMEAIDRLPTNMPFKCLIAVLAHDWGKATTSADILPHHYGHEIRSEKISREWLKENRFSRHVNEFVPMVGLLHMKVHKLQVMKPNKLLNLFRNIRRDERDNFIMCCNCDSPLTAADWNHYSTVIDVLNTTHIVPPAPDCLEKHQYVDNQYRRVLTGRINELREKLNNECS